MFRIHEALQLFKTTKSQIWLLLRVLHIMSLKELNPRVYIFM